MPQQSAANDMNFEFPNDRSLIRPRATAQTSAESILHNNNLKSMWYGIFLLMGVSIAAITPKSRFATFPPWATGLGTPTNF